MQWHDIINRYSSTALTFEKDYFPALQGLAKRVSPSMGEYLAGLWSTSLWADLAWRLDPFTASSNRPEFWRAPTWSWASTTGRPILCSDKQQPTDLVMVSANIVPMGDDPTGELKSAELVLEGCLVKASVIHLDHLATWALPLPSLSVSSAGLALYTKKKRLLFTPGRRGPRCLWDYKIESPGAHHVSDGEDVFLMKILEGNGVNHSIWMIIRSSPKKTGTFERIGLFIVSHWALEHTHPWASREPSDEISEERTRAFAEQGEYDTFEEIVEVEQALRHKYEDSPEIQITLV